jgi:DNA-binding HxlR family transcriptional regulator
MSYGQFCPISKAAESVAEKWSLIVVRELLAGSETFNALRSGMPLISPTLLSRRRTELEEAGLVEKRETRQKRP